MDMNQVIARINELAKKAKTEGLNDAETAERDKLRRIYIDSVKANLVGQLDNTYLVRPDGSKEKLKPKQSNSAPAGALISFIERQWLVADYGIHILFRTKSKGLDHAEFGGIADKDPLFCLLQHGFSHGDLLFLHIGDDTAF